MPPYPPQSSYDQTTPETALEPQVNAISGGTGNAHTIPGTVNEDGTAMPPYGSTVGYIGLYPALVTDPGSLTNNGFSATIAVSSQVQDADTGAAYTADGTETVTELGIWLDNTSGSTLSYNLGLFTAVPAAAGQHRPDVLVGIVESGSITAATNAAQTIVLANPVVLVNGTVYMVAASGAGFSLKYKDADTQFDGGTSFDNSVSGGVLATPWAESSVQTDTNILLWAMFNK